MDVPLSSMYLPLSSSLFSLKSMKTFIFKEELKLITQSGHPCIPWSRSHVHTFHQKYTKLPGPWAIEEQAGLPQRKAQGRLSVYPAPRVGAWGSDALAAHPSLAMRHLKGVSNKRTT